MDFAKPVAIVTGASSGFGLMASVKLAQEGYFVISTMRDGGKQQKVMEAAEQAGVGDRIRCIQLDVTNHERIDEEVTKVVLDYGRIDLLVNNAGYAVAGFIEELEMDDWRRQFETNFFGTVAVTKAVLPVMRNQLSGKIINISSVSGLFGFPAMAPYVASKFAIEGFSESLRMEMLPFNVHVVLVEPGAFKTEIWSKSEIKTSPGSFYIQYADGLQKILTKTVERAGDPAAVVNLIARIAKTDYPKLRYPIGRGVRLNIALKRLLPWKWLERAVTRMVKS